MGMGMSPARQSSSRGAWAERLVARCYEELGAQILQRRFRFGRYEIDLILKDQDELVFVEVKSRANKRFADPLESIDPSKVQRTRIAAEGYLEQMGLPETSSVRFDAAVVIGSKVEIFTNCF